MLICHKSEVRLRLGIENKQVYFALLSTCTNFVKNYKNGCNY